MNTPGPGDGGKSSHTDEDLARQYASAKRELDEIRQMVTRLTAERDNARRQCAQYTNELNMARNREEALHGRIRQLDETVKSLQGGAIMAGIAGFAAALLVRKRR